MVLIVNLTQPPSPGPLLRIVSIRLVYRHVSVEVSRRTQSTLGGTILRYPVLDYTASWLSMSLFIRWRDSQKRVFLLELCFL